MIQRFTMKKVHFIAIGGSVMHQLALSLHQKGYQVSGSDDEIFEPARSNLAAAGLLPASLGWEPARITPDLDAVILGMHAREDNPELIRARQLELPIYSFPEYIYQESLHKTRVVIGGSHGKTTITAMIMHVLQHAGMDFDYLVGARLEGFDLSVRISNAPLIICEGDEYPASAIQKQPKFHFLHPHIAVLSGIAWDHINIFPTFENYTEQFDIFIKSIEPGGHLIYNVTDPVLRHLTAGAPAGLHLHPYDLPPHSIRKGITFVRSGETDIPLQVFGEHNLMNLCAAKLVCQQLGITEKLFSEAIQSFKGAARRLELVYRSDHAALYRDFAHAPSKVKASIKALKDQFLDRRLVAVLELHTYSSLNAAFLKEYQHAMDMADNAVVYYSHHALMLKKLPDISPDDIRRGFDREDLETSQSPEELLAQLQEKAHGSVNLLMMSSGNFDGLDLATLEKLLAHA